MTHWTEAGTVGAAVSAGVSTLRAAGSSSPRLDAELLVAYAVGRDRSWVLAHPEVALPSVAVGAFDQALARRAAGEPIAYIRGFKEWLSLRIRTDARSLIPRPETEVLAEAAMTELAERLVRDDERVVAWDVATGSGAVALALALRFRSALALGRMTLVASDRSADALELAADNLAAHGVEALVNIACADLLAPAGGSLPRPDVIVANLPYMPSAEVDAARGMLAHEPRVALDGGADGLDLLRRLFAELPHRAARGASLLLEVGIEQAPAVASLAPTGATVERRADLAGMERVVVIRLPR